MLNPIFKDYLFNKRILVNDYPDAPTDKPFEVIFTLTNKLGIQITNGAEHACLPLVEYAADKLGKYVPTAFYRGFPNTVREMSSDFLLYDQLLHYSITYGLGIFSLPGHSMFEADFKRAAFRENSRLLDFSIVTEDEALPLLKESVLNLFKSSRPLSSSDYGMLKTYIEEFSFKPDSCACKETAFRLIIDLGDVSYADFIKLSDVPLFVSVLNFRNYRSKRINKLNLKNSDRKLIAAIINRITEQSRVNTVECFEKQATWCGLLHHIHYKPTCPAGAKFAKAMRDGKNISVYSDFEAAIATGDVKTAATILKQEKGSGALLRKLNFLISRCTSPEQIEEICGMLSTNKAILLIQLLKQYRNYKPSKQPRSFKFTRFGMLSSHLETEAEMLRRRSALSRDQVKELTEKLTEKLKNTLAGRLGRVYVDKDMSKMALPLQEATSMGGFGTLAKGSRIKINVGEKKLRSFVYWEKVNDIDLSALALMPRGEIKEFSWRTMFEEQSDGILFSGDQTSGYDGGSEFYDIDIEKFKAKHKGAKYLVFTANVYSSLTFDKCFCRAGYMLRDLEDSGEIFEPKTVESSYTVDCPSSYAYLFAIDLRKNELVWLNTGIDSLARIAYSGDTGVIEELFEITKLINVRSFFEMMATELVSDPEKADIVVTDKPVKVSEHATVVHSYDFDKLIAYLNL